MPGPRLLAGFSIRAAHAAHGRPLWALVLTWLMDEGWDEILVMGQFGFPNFLSSIKILTLCHPERLRGIPA
jgi:hypothetical protein